MIASLHQNHNGGSRMIHPEDMTDLKGWSKKWGVSVKELQDAVLTTGSINPVIVKNYLKRDSWLYHPVDGTIKLLRKTIGYIF